MARLKMLEAPEVAPEYQDIIGTGMNLHKVMMNSPRTARMSRQVGLYLRNTCTLDPKLRELAIIQVAFMARSAYEYTHHLKIAADIGIPPEILSSVAVESVGAEHSSDTDTATVLRAAREMWTDLEISQATFAELARHLSPEHIVDLVFTVSYYCGFVRLTASLGIQTEPSYLSLLDQYPFPETVPR